ncbi:MAG: hypothetical protein LBS56_09245, partial [Propionibacteriaceae bacterium]|nr:hypothetical protein [Propionibacteriaceae bacterium]
MPQPPWSDRAAAADAVARSQTSAADLAAIVRAHPDLGVDVAFHPNAYPGLLDWLADYGQPAVKDAVRRRRAGASGGPVPPPGGAGWSAAPGATPTRSEQFPPPGSVPGSAPPGSVSPGARPPVPPSAAAPAPRPKRGFARVGVVVGVAVVLVAGGAVFAFRDELFGGSGEPGGPPPATPGLIVENPPTLTSSFADGLSELWRFYGAEVEVVDPSVVIVTPREKEGAEVDAFAGLDPDTGEVLWTSGTFTTGPSRWCDPSLWQGHAVCWTAGGWGSHPFLIDAATGQQTRMTWLKDWQSWAVDEAFVSEGALYVVQTEGDGDLGDLCELTRYDSPAQAAWTTSFMDRYGLGSLASSARVGDLVVVEGLSAQVFDAHDGTLVAGDEECPWPVVFGGNHVTCDADADDVPSETVTLSNGATMTKTFARTTPLVFDGSERPSAVLVWDEDKGLTRLDPLTGQEMWHNDLDLGPNWTLSLAVGHGEQGDEGGIVIVSETGPRALVDLGTGEVEWQKAQRPEGQATYHLDPDVTVLGDGFLWIASADADRRGSVVSLATGDAVVETDYAFGQGSDGLFVARRQSVDHVARLAPNGSVAAPPEGLPDCQAGLSPVAWALYADDHVLVCGSAAGGFWAAVLHDGEYLTPTKLTFTGGGWTVESDGGTTVAVTLEGGVVEVAGRGSGTHGAFGALFGHPVVDLSGAGEFRSCPAGARLLSLSTFDGGWMMVCGTAADAPTFA